jgi:hypothetical protein
LGVIAEQEIIHIYLFFSLSATLLLDVGSSRLHPQILSPYRKVLAYERARRLQITLIAAIHIPSNWTFSDHSIARQ